MIFEWSFEAGMTASENIKSIAEDTSCSPAICDNSVVSDGVANAENYFQEFSDMINLYAEALYTDGENIGKKTIYLNTVDTIISDNLV